MERRITAHDLADYARCPRAWWYDRHQELARLDPEALAARLQARRAALGRRAPHDPEIELLVRLIERHQRFAGGRAAHRAAARRDAAPARAFGCLPMLAILCAPALLLWLLCMLAQG